MATSPQPLPNSAPGPAWYRRLPSLRRFLFWNMFWWTFGVSALIGGVVYTEMVVVPVAEAGSTDFSPLQVFKKEEAGRRVFGNSERLNILIAGLDHNYDSKGILYTKGARSDTLMVLSLSREAKFCNVVNIPRDTQVWISDDIGYEKINSAYSFGGIDQTVETVKDFLGIPIHHYVVLKVDGAQEVIDALGGLPIDVEKDMDYDDNWGNLHIHLRKGPQVLDGEQAVGYARFRMDEEGDRGRIRRQQQVIRALGAKLREPALISRLDEVARVVKDNIDTDLKFLQMLDLANLYSGFDFSHMRTAAIVGDDAVDPDGISYIVPYEPENRRTVRRLLQNLDWLRKDDLRIRIFHKKAPSSIAYDLADNFYNSGFRGVQVEELAWDDDTPSDHTRVVWYNDVPRLHSVVQTLVGEHPSTVAPIPEGRDDDLAIFLGDDEVGDWKELPRESFEDDNDRGSRYHPSFYPRSLPAPDSYSQDDYGDTDSNEDVLTPDYPTRDRQNVDDEWNDDAWTDEGSWSDDEGWKNDDSHYELDLPVDHGYPSESERIDESSQESTDQLPLPVPVEIELPEPVATPISPF